ncbi:hypothetical protein B0H11DRAFT_2245202 [Mycena galericulata]|nr:hypothetical protein B0H11DRAFT_2245202 [Mycena galericulata]
MNHRQQKENLTSTSNNRRRLPIRAWKLSERVKKNREAKTAKEKELHDKKRSRARRKALKQRGNESALTVERPDDTPEVRELRAALARALGEHNAAEAAADKPHHEHEPVPLGAQQTYQKDDSHHVEAPKSPKSTLQRYMEMMYDSDPEVFQGFYKGTGPLAPSHSPDSSPSPPPSRSGITATGSSRRGPPLQPFPCWAAGNLKCTDLESLFQRRIES